jgi:putative colanic acid biosysnthesis UDP-glucose lipid carrier transferase
MNVLERNAVTQQAKRNDTRVTSIGRMLRQTSIDELPQLWNVVKGDMSLIGPRPHSLTHDAQYRSLIGNYDMRYNVKPGITGWAQVNGFRGETARLELMARRITFDLWYINNWSLWLDLRIMVRTCVAVARAGAY